jgi:hypothetical protein
MVAPQCWHFHSSLVLANQPLPCSVLPVFVSACVRPQDEHFPRNIAAMPMHTAAAIPMASPHSNR